MVKMGGFCTTDFTDYTDFWGHREPGAASGFALGRNQKVRPVKKSHNTLKIKMLRSPDRKNVHKKQEDTRLYYRLTRTENRRRRMEGGKQEIRKSGEQENGEFRI